MLYLNALLRQQYSHNHNDSFAMNPTMLMVIIGTLHSTPFPSLDVMITVLPLLKTHHRNSNKHTKER